MNSDTDITSNHGNSDSDWGSPSEDLNSDGDTSCEDGYTDTREHKYFCRKCGAGFSLYVSILRHLGEHSEDWKLLGY